MEAPVSFLDVTIKSEPTEVEEDDLNMTVDLNSSMEEDTTAMNISGPLMDDQESVTAGKIVQRLHCQR